MPAKQLSDFARYMLITGVCAGIGVSVNALEGEGKYPDAEFLEYLASLEEVDGEWLGPEQMQYLRESIRTTPELESAPELLVTPGPDQLSSEQEEKK